MKNGLRPRRWTRKAAGGQGDRVGDQIGGDHPGGFVLAHAQPARHIREGDVGDGGVEDLHEGARSRPPRRSARDWERGSQPFSQAFEEGRLGVGIRTVGTTDMPGPSATSDGALSMTIFTGTRWTILTKLPVAFSAGSSEKAVPEPGCTLATWPLIVALRIGIDFAADRLSGAQRVELRLLEVRGDPDLVGHEHRQAGAGLRELADRGAELDDSPGCAAVTVV